MYTNLAYLGNAHEDIADTSKALIVTAAGCYRVLTIPVVNTVRSEGRNDYQLIYVASGKLHMFVDGKEKIISKGNILLFRPGVTQIYDLHAADKPETFWVHFTGSDVDSILAHYNMPTDEIVIFAGTSSDYEWLFLRMIKELQLKQTGFDEFLIISLRHILLMVNRYAGEYSQIGSDTIREAERAVHFFNENYTKDVSVESYAKERHISTCWFIRSFKQVTKMTPMQYILSLRINGAISLMDTTNYNISQIAASVGYENPLYFSRLFKKHTGFSPSEYKNRNKK